MMEELERLKEAIHPDEILLVADGMTGQDAVKIAQGFDQRLDVTGVILTKMDGDARGGAALSIYGVTKKPIKYIGVGEKPDALEEFHPDRMAGRILQQGDIVSLVEKAQGAFDADEAKSSRRRSARKGWTSSDFLAAMKQIEQLGPLEGLLKMLPGVNTKMLKQVKAADPEAHEARRGDRAVDDARGAEEAGDHERLAPRARRQGLRPPDQRSEPAARAVPRDAEDDEEGVGSRPGGGGKFSPNMFGGMR